jgi:hypothetical protein
MDVSHRLSQLLVFIFLAPIMSAVPQTGAAHPDLSGTWIFNSAKSEPANHVANRSETLQIACSTTTFEVHYLTDGKTSTQTFVIDGAEHTGRQMQSGNVYSQAEWKGSELVTDLRATLEGGSNLIRIRKHWRISKDGQVLTQVIEGPAKRIFVYDKQAGGQPSRVAPE